MNRDRLLIVEDDEMFSGALAGMLKSQFDVVVADTKADAIEQLHVGAFHGVLLDIRLGGDHSEDRQGLELLDEIRKERPLLPVVVMTGIGSVQLAVRAMNLGADDFVEKGVAEPASYAKAIRKAIAKKREDTKLRSQLERSSQSSFTNLVGASSAMDAVHEKISMAAEDGHCSVLILGETGVGKEVVASSIHSAGWRTDRPFVAVSTPALSETLLESELFGHEKGAFTGAENKHVGFLERADGGVLFLDEVADLAVPLQVKLLRFLEDRTVHRIGATVGFKIDVQIVSATNRNLSELVRDGKFREDLFYRLCTVEINIPALRERSDDIPLLADHFLQQLRKQGRTKLAGFSERAIENLRAREYRGNVRELKNVVESSVLTADFRKHWIVEFEDLSDSSVLTPAVAESSKMVAVTIDEALALTEMRCLNNALIRTHGKKNEALKMLAYPNRQTMRRRINRLRDEFPELWAEFPLLVEKLCRQY